MWQIDANKDANKSSTAMIQSYAILCQSVAVRNIKWCNINDFVLILSFAFDFQTLAFSGFEKASVSI